ncbi:MAG: hypothetical protein SF051_04250 [Elusimicrobiota bacterium]|nr:hypothetical protein [Elusimicrobiota bacterium]
MSPLLVLLLACPAAASAQSMEAVWRAGAAAFDAAALSAPALTAPRRAAAEPPLALSDLARALAADPKAVDDLLDLIVANAGLLGRAVDTPQRRAELKAALRAADPAVLDRFPTMTTAQLAQAATLYASRQGPNPVPNRPATLVFALTGAPRDPAPGQFLRPLGYGLFYGDESLSGAGAPYGDSVATAAALDQLSAELTLQDGGASYRTVLGWLGALLASGHTLEVRDRRMHANFGDLRYETGGRRRDVATPTLADTGIVLPSGRRLIVPIPHSELDLSIRGPRVNAELSWFFGVDGKAAFRPLGTVDQGWVGGRTVRTWTGADAARLLDKAAAIGRALEAKALAANLPMGGYGPLGSCNDANAFVTGIPPYGMTRDPRRYAGSDPLDAVSAGLPYDAAAPADPRRVWESRAFEDPADTPLPEVRAALLELKSVLGL